MHYDMALKTWGFIKLKPYIKQSEKVDIGKIDVYMNFSEGYSCCAGRDPDCYCSFATPPSAEVSISAYTNKGRYVSYDIDLACFDFATILKEIVEAADGNIGLE